MPSSKKKETVIVKFKSRKQKRKILIDMKNLHNNFENRSQLEFVGKQLKFTGKLFIPDSMGHDKHQLSYKCRQKKNAGKIHSTWFWSNVINVKLNERSQPAKIYHIVDIEKLLGVDNLDESINNTLFIKSFLHFP